MTDAQNDLVDAITWLQYAAGLTVTAKKQVAELVNAAESAIRIIRSMPFDNENDRQQAIETVIKDTHEGCRAKTATGRACNLS
ncbi:hypothetical protein [Mycolicibacterium obuense]|uniref:hypothetical protein n=1 Tax=Mycolicibacterium obuense TaxID=1807 RepID=UPI00103ABC0B|nr:hypothetical protein [Mycolicibacterium obuense]